MSHVILMWIVSYAVEPIELDTLLQNPMIFSQSLLPSGELVASSIQGKITIYRYMSPDISTNVYHCRPFHTRPDQGLMIITIYSLLFI